MLSTLIITIVTSSLPLNSTSCHMKEVSPDNTLLKLRPLSPGSSISISDGVFPSGKNPPYSFISWSQYDSTPSSGRFST
ncbi:hypothetical protein D3C85_1565400 [compost metagenome]